MNTEGAVDACSVLTTAVGRLDGMSGDEGRSVLELYRIAVRSWAFSRISTRHHLGSPRRAVAGLPDRFAAGRHPAEVFYESPAWTPFSRGNPLGGVQSGHCGSEGREVLQAGHHGTFMRMPSSARRLATTWTACTSACQATSSRSWGAATRTAFRCGTICPVPGGRSPRHGGVGSIPSGRDAEEEDGPREHGVPRTSCS